MTTALVKCKCENEFQDKKYGEKIRVANKTQKGDDKTVDVRCTVCGTIHRINRSQLR